VGKRRREAVEEERSSSARARTRDAEFATTTTKKKTRFRASLEAVVGAVGVGARRRGWREEDEGGERIGREGARGLAGKARRRRTNEDL